MVLHYLNTAAELYINSVEPMAVFEPDKDGMKRFSRLSANKHIITDVASGNQLFIANEGRLNDSTIFRFG
jgi:hypothetical protein